MSGLTEERVREIFAQEAAVRLTKLSQLLLQLENAGHDETLIGSVFRELHTLKGSAAIAGLGEVSECAHQLEELADDLRTGRRVTSSEVIDELLSGTDRLSKLITPAQPSSEGTAVLTGPSAGPVVGSHATSRPTVAKHPSPSLRVLPARAARATSGSEAPGTASRPGPRPIGTASNEVSRRLLRPAEPTTAGAAKAAILVQTERLEELTRLVGESASAHLRVGQMLKDRFGVDPASCAEYNELSRSLNDLQDRATRTQMVPVSTITDQLQRAVRDLSRAQGKDVRWETRGVDTELDRAVLHQLADSLLHMVRNAVDHGIEEPTQRLAVGKPAHGTIRLHAMQLGSEVIIAVTDDGRGIDTAALGETANSRGIDTSSLTEEELLALTLQPGLSTTAFVTDVSGRGVGLDVVRTNVELARGRVEIRSQPGTGTEFRVIVPITLAVLQCLLVEAGGQRFALPFHRVVLTQAYEPSKKVSAEGRLHVWVNKQPVALSVLTDVLGTPAADPVPGPIVVLADTSRQHAFQVDRLVGQRDVVLKGLSRLLPNLPVVAGASVEPDGSVLVVLDPPGLIHRARQAASPHAPGAELRAQAGPRRRVLVVDDALTVRELQRNILERAGFDVRVATDGADALSKLAEESSDLVLTDVEMPTMDGFALTEAIRAHSTLANIPVLILSSRSSEADRQRGLDVGADGYLIKSGFDEASLLGAVNRLLGTTP